jgi:hypothetical protein
VARADIPPLETIRDADRLLPYVRRVARETYFDPDWLWNFCKGMQEAGLPTERTIDALERQHTANRLPWHMRLWRRIQIKLVKGFWDY